MEAVGVYSVDKLMSEARRLAAEYRRATGQPLAIGGEIAKYDAGRLLDMEVIADAQAGFDLVGRAGERHGKRYQVKGRAIFDEAKGGQRIGQLKVEQPWDGVVLVLMDDEFEPYEIYEAGRDELLDALTESEGSRRNKRGAMSVAKFKVIGQLVWTREEGVIDDGIWQNQP